MGGDFEAAFEALSGLLSAQCERLAVAAALEDWAAKQWV
jgi:hypothetical protein